MCFRPAQKQLESQEPEEPALKITTVKVQAEQQRISFPANCPDIIAAAPASASASASPPGKDRLRVTSAGACARLELNFLDMA
jgi:hypothetical protein